MQAMLQYAVPVPQEKMLAFNAVDEADRRSLAARGRDKLWAEVPMRRLPGPRFWRPLPAATPITRPNPLWAPRGLSGDAGLVVTSATPLGLQCSRASASPSPSPCTARARVRHVGAPRPSSCCIGKPAVGPIMGITHVPLLSSIFRASCY